MSQLHHLQLGTTTDISGAMEKLAHLIRKRAMVVLISDFYQETEKISKALRFFHHRGNDVVMFHLLDPAELELPFGEMTTLEDMETEEYLPYVPEQSRSSYLELLREHLETLRKECRNIYVDYELVRTDQPLDWALHRYLSLREKRY